MTGYDEEAQYFDAAVRAEKRKDLVSKAYAAVGEVRTAQLDALRVKLLRQFKDDLRSAMDAGDAPFTATAAGLGIEALEAFEEAATDLDVEGSGWTASEAYSQLQRDVATHVRALEEKKVAEVTKQTEGRLSDNITGAAIALLDSAPADLWPRAQRLHTTATAAAYEAVTANLEGYELSAEEWADIKQRLETFARRKLESLVREASHTALSRMKDRFGEVFSRDEAGMPRMWAPRVDIPGVAAEARAAAAQLLALLAIVRLGVPASVTAPIDACVISLAEQQDRASHTSGITSINSSCDGDSPEFDMLSASEWPEVPHSAVLLSPGQCRGLWRQFLSDSNFMVQQALATQEANRAASNRMPPLWAAAAIVLLGWNEFISVLRNPLWLLFGLILFLFGKTVYQDLEVDAELQRGLLPGLLVLSSKFVPTLRSATARTLASIQQFAAEAPAKAQDTIAAVRSPSSHKAAASGNGGGHLRRRGEPAPIEMTGSSLSSNQTAAAFNGDEEESSKDK